MAVTYAPRIRDPELALISEWVRRRQEKELGVRLDAFVGRLMPGPNGRNFDADFALQDPKHHFPVLVFEVWQGTKSIMDVKAQLARLRESLEFLKLIRPPNARVPRIGVVVPAARRSEGEKLVEEGVADLMEAY